MLIQVEYPGGHFDYVKESMLEMLIESRKIVKFRRSSGWATLGVDAVRHGSRATGIRSWEPRRSPGG